MSKVKKERKKKERVYGFLDPLCFYLEISFKMVYICITSVTYNTPQPQKKKKRG